MKWFALIIALLTLPVDSIYACDAALRAIKGPKASTASITNTDSCMALKPIISNKLMVYNNSGKSIKSVRMMVKGFGCDNVHTPRLPPKSIKIFSSPVSGLVGTCTIQKTFVDLEGNKPGPTLEKDLSFGGITKSNSALIEIVETNGSLTISGIQLER
jgi:hypothetical protein